LLCGAAIGLPGTALVATLDAFAVALLALPLMASLPVLLEQDIDRGVQRLTGLAIGLWYLPVTLSLMVLLARDPRGGPGLLLALCLGVALSDVGAFTFGRLWGRRPLAPRLSPSKTLAGLAGNVAGAAVGLALLSPLTPYALVFVPVVAIGAVWGDLLESLLKRAARIKDAGQWLPGFGGLLDRVDSLLVVLPLAFVALKVSP
jgi:phosphatidate cytidylyltransferase